MHLAFKCTYCDDGQGKYVGFVRSRVEVDILPRESQVLSRSHARRHREGG